MVTIACINGTSRTFKYLVPQALAKGHKVRAIVRSTSRFREQTPKKHDNLSVHEWRDFRDITGLTTILEGVDVVYIALGVNDNNYTTLNQDAAHAITAVLAKKLPQGAGAKSQTKIVILCSASTLPKGNEYRRGGFLDSQLLYYQYEDLRRTQAFLEKQSAWLDVIYVMPGMIVDAPEPESATTELRLYERREPEGAISYRRLAAAMLSVGDEKEGQWVGKYVSPQPTTKVAVRFQDLTSIRSIFSFWFRNTVFPYVFRAVGFGLLGGAVGYVFGVREQGIWPTERFGINLK